MSNTCMGTEVYFSYDNIYVILYGFLLHNMYTWVTKNMLLYSDIALDSVYMPSCFVYVQYATPSVSTCQYNIYVVYYGLAVA